MKPFRLLLLFTYNTYRHQRQDTYLFRLEAESLKSYNEISSNNTRRVSMSEQEGTEAFYAVGKNRIGVLVIHGCTGSPHSVRYLARSLARADYTVASPCLSGHGTTPADMATKTASDWIANLNADLDWLKERCDSLFVAGLSMGGTLTLYLAGQYPDLFKGIIPINAPIFFNLSAYASLAYMRGGPAEAPGVSGDIKAPGVTDLSYPVIPVPTIKELLAIMKVTEEMLPLVTCPALLIISREDHVVPPTNGEYILSLISSQEKRILWLEDSYHVATLDNDKKKIVQESIAFIQAHTPV
jgi:carboxylesterase